MGVMSSENNLRELHTDSKIHQAKLNDEQDMRLVGPAIAHYHLGQLS